LLKKIYDKEGANEENGSSKAAEDPRSDLLAAIQKSNPQP
jgi:hypothetical protein